MPIFDATAPISSNPQIIDPLPSGQKFAGVSDMATPSPVTNLASGQATPNFRSIQGLGSYG